MREADFWQSTLRSIVNRIDGYNKHYTLQQQEAWERSRLVAYFSVMPHTKKGKIKAPTDLVKFPWETPKAHSFDIEAAKKRAMEFFERDRKREELNGQVS